MKLRDLPSVDELARKLDDPLAVDAARAVLARARETIAAGGSPEDLDALLRAEVRALRAPRLRRVLNATGVLVHTNLGRAPLAEHALERVVEAARGYSNLEYDLAEGRRGSRQEHVAAALRRLTGAEAALVVNNNAAAVLLALAALAGGREGIVSRGGLIQIGDGFRIPDVLARSGARLREVGTTNRTRAADFERAIGPETGALLRVHQSNFRVVGFTGDKLLGGPQAGVVVGRAELVERLRRHPLQRAVRADKLTLAALEGTLALYAEPARAAREVPVLRMLGEPEESVRARAARLAETVGGEVEETVARVGGGALPLAEIASYACAVEEELAAPLRAGGPPGRGVVRDGRLLLDCRTLTDAEAEEVAAAVATARSARSAEAPAAGGPGSKALPTSSPLRS